MAQQHKYFYILTIQKPNINGTTAMATFSSDIDIPEGWTRQDVYRWARKDMEAAQPELRGGIVLLFSLEANQL